MYNIVIISLWLIVGIGWAAYGVWKLTTRLTNKDKPKRTTEHRQQREDAFDDYIEKLQHYEKKPYGRK